MSVHIDATRMAMQSAHVAAKTRVSPLEIWPTTNGDTAGFDKPRCERWYVVHTRPHAESRAVMHLQWQGYRSLCPRYRRIVRHARRAKSVLAPLFPNYLFVYLNLGCDPWRAVNSTHGVARLVMQGEMPQPLPQGIVEELLVRTRADGALDWTPSFKIGQAVRIVDGPFAEFVGTLEHLDAAGRVRVLLDLLGRSVSVALRSGALMAAA